MSVPIPESLFFLAFGSVVAWFLYRLLKYGGFRGAMYGSRVARTVGELALERRLGASKTLRVHVLEDGRIVLEETTRASLSIAMTGTTMSPAETDRLLGLLQQARAY
jgi:hypothetical protein